MTDLNHDTICTALCCTDTFLKYTLSYNSFDNIIMRFPVVLHGTFIIIESFCFLIDLSLHSGKKSLGATNKINSMQIRKRF